MLFYSAKLMWNDAVFSRAFVSCLADMQSNPGAAPILTSTRVLRIKSTLWHRHSALGDPLAAAAAAGECEAILKKITAWEENLITPKQETFQDVINFYNRLNAELLDLKNRVDVHDPRPTTGAATRLNDLTKEWETHKATLDKLINVEVAKFNEMYKQKAIPALIVPEK